jgi:hypothetical protein
MSLLAQVNQPNPNRYYFALDTSPTDPTVTAPAFEATGTATSNGAFSALGTAVPGGIGMFNMETTLGRAQWAIGMDAVPAGGNSGDNFALFSYDDNGAFLSAPLQVIRATGGVITQNGLTTTTLAATGAVTADSLIVGDGTEAGGALAQINGTSGLGRVYDTVYNPALPPQNDFLFNFTGAPITSPANNYGVFGTFTVPVTGLYIVTSTVQVSVDFTNSATFGPSDTITVETNVASVANGITFKPFSMPNRASGGQDYVLNGTVVCRMLAATSYQAQIRIDDVSGTASYLAGVTPTLTIARLV